MSNSKQLEKDIAYCIDILELSNEQIGELLRACEEFIFECDDLNELNRYHDENYLKLKWRLD